MRAIAMRILFALAPIVLGMAAALPSDAAEANLCGLNVTPVRFGTYNPFSPAAARANGSITYDCSAGTPISIALEHSSGTSPTTRVMTQGPHILEYNLYLDAACTVAWGDGTGGGQMYRDPAPPSDSPVSVPIYGCIRAGQRDALVGPYMESFAVTINF